MRFSALLATAGVVSILFGALFLLAPATGLVQYGVSTDATGLFASAGGWRCFCWCKPR